MLPPILKLLLAAAIIAATLAAAPSAARLAGHLRVSSDGRTLVASGGEPFYYMADTAWELVARLTREEAVEYLDHRKAARFTVIQLAAVTCFTGAGPNIYGDRAFDGTVDRPLVTPGASPDDPAAYDYWDHTEFVIDQAARRGMTVALTTSSAEWHAEAWLDFNSVQTGHERDRAFPYALVEADFARSPAKPVVDFEPFYEDFAKPWGRSDASDVRKSAYWSVFAGAFGHSYGHVAVFQMWKPQFKAWDGARMLWRDALGAEGAGDMRHLRALMESRPVAGRVPDQSLVIDPLAGAEHIRATRGPGYIFVYSPHGSPFTLGLKALPAARRRAWWFDPRDGHAQGIGRLPDEGPLHTFTPPSHGRGHDWILVVDDESRRYPAPGSPRS